ncbi:hypothetical protein Vadar_006282 [Vaccinium darrowii]|uniref:Uncharacterized protein n=1 Tax=Vaccinium darrowii TaxID=229202 RepID=A0ACB7WYC4_9ERIC|nr:hypothetical protein Vadar_006282 [Vaccinium darrowii]
MILSHLCDEPKGLKTSMCMSLLFLPFGIANALTARLNDGVPLVDERWVLLLYCAYTGLVLLPYFSRSNLRLLRNIISPYIICTLFALCHISHSRDNNSPWNILLQDNTERSLRCATTVFCIHPYSSWQVRSNVHQIHGLSTVTILG